MRGASLATYISREAGPSTLSSTRFSGVRTEYMYTDNAGVGGVGLKGCVGIGHPSRSAVWGWPMVVGLFIEMVVIQGYGLR